MTKKMILGCLGLAVALTLLGVSKIPPKQDDNVIVLTENNVVVLSGEIGSEDSTKAIAQGRALDQKSVVDAAKRHLGLKSNDPIYVFMNTPGGSVQAGLELMEAFHGLNHPVKTISLFSASMGFQIVQGLGERLVLENGVLMSHRAFGGLEASFGGQRPSPFENRLGLFLGILQKLDIQTVKRTNGKQTLESYQKAYADEMWRTGDVAVEQGYADRVVVIKCDSSLKGNETHHVNFFGLDISYELDRCPINTGIMNVKINFPPRGGEDDEADDTGKKSSKGKKSKEKPKESKKYTEASIDPDEVQDIKERFIESYNRKMKTPLNMYW